jgi:response regulator RpfG family c-di-GMP phosphodiesterase
MAAESLIMLLLWFIPSIPPLIQIAIDVTILTLILVPLIYRLVYLPLTQFTFNLQETNQQLIGTQGQTLSLLIALAAARDDETGQHLIRSQKYVLALAERLKKMGHYADELDNDFIEILYKVAPLHDIGKVGISDKILNKPTNLSEEERIVMYTHATIGESILDAAKLSFDGTHGLIATAIEIAGAHHEKWDGTGYPKRLKGQDIPLAGRIMSVADVYDALVGKRAYKESWTHEQAVQEITSKKGLSFDPVIVDAFLLEDSHFKQIAADYQ